MSSDVSHVMGQEEIIQKWNSVIYTSTFIAWKTDILPFAKMKKMIQGWNDICKWWQNFHFGKLVLLEDDVISTGYMELHRDWWSRAALLSWEDGSRRMTCIDFSAGLRSHIILQTITDQLPLASVLSLLFYLTLGKYKYIKTSSVICDTWSGIKIQIRWSKDNCSVYICKQKQNKKMNF